MVDEPAVEAASSGNIVGMLRTLSDPTRLRLLSILTQGELSVTALCDELQLAQPTVSHHLGRLRSARLVANRRDGKRVYYSLNQEVVTQPGGRNGLTIAAGLLELHIHQASANGSNSVNGESI